LTRLAAAASEGVFGPRGAPVVIGNDRLRYRVPPRQRLDEPRNLTIRRNARLVRRNNESFAVRHPASPPHAPRHWRDQI